MKLPFVVQLTSSQCQLLKQALEEKEFQFSQPQYTLFQAKLSGVVCTLYSSGKLVVQGREAQEFIEFFLEPEILQNFASSQRDLRPRIGVDESGKGDIFGPLCVAGVYAPDTKALDKLYASSIQDSKKLADKQIKSLAKLIKSCCVYHIITLVPQKYNELYAQFRNLNSLLAWGHATVIGKLAPKPNASDTVFAISDQFAASEAVLLNALKRKKIQLPLIQRTKAEQDVVVASASILAREAFLTTLEHLEQIYHLKLPKGASDQVKAMLKTIVREQGKEVLSALCKLHFKPCQELLS